MKNRFIPPKIAKNPTLILKDVETVEKSGLTNRICLPGPGRIDVFGKDPDEKWLIAFNPRPAWHFLIKRPRIKKQNQAAHKERPDKEYEAAH
jgi:hypothetical protein